MNATANGNGTPWPLSWLKDLSRQPNGWAIVLVCVVVLVVLGVIPSSLGTERLETKVEGHAKETHDEHKEQTIAINEIVHALRIICENMADDEKSMRNCRNISVPIAEREITRSYNVPEAAVRPL